MTVIKITIFITMYLSLIHHSRGFEVIQPESKTVNVDGSASVGCEHTANDTIEDVRLNRRALVEKQSGRSVLCQWGMKDCHNIILYQENSRKYLFIMLYIGAKDMDFGYECEFTVTKDDLRETRRGRPTRLLPGPKEAQQVLVLHSPPPPQTPPPPQSVQLMWTLIGLLTLMLLYSCLITGLYIRLRSSRRDSDINSTYVEMRKVPQRGNFA